MLMIGSRALQIRCPELLRREPLDFDFICTEAEYEEWFAANRSKFGEKPDCYSIEHATQPKRIVKSDLRVSGGKTPVICEFEIIKEGCSNAMLPALCKTDGIETSMGLIPSLDMLFTIKKSHRFLKNAPSFWRTVWDYHAMKLVGCTVRPEYEAFYALREKETYAKQNHPKLNTSKDKFFADDAITYLHDHDDIHRAVAIFERPAYTYYMRDGAEVQCDKEKFFALPEKYRLAGVAEEACTLSIERSLVPWPGIKSDDEAWHYALMKTCSSITSGWFREYAHSEIFKVIKLYHAEYQDYHDRFKKALAEGRIKPFTGTKYPSKETSNG